MNLKIWQLISIILSASVAGMFCGPWVALSRSLNTFEPGVFLALVHQMNQNMAQVMTILMPAALLSIIPVLFISYNEQRRTFYLTLAGFAFFIVTLLVTVLVEVPLVKQIDTWTDLTLPDNWQQLRDRWGAFHVIRIVASIAGLVLLAVGRTRGCSSHATRIKGNRPADHIRADPATRPLRAEPDRRAARTQREYCEMAPTCGCQPLSGWAEESDAAVADRCASAQRSGNHSSSRSTGCIGKRSNASRR
jgi:uncharacterized membrane protein